MPAVHELGRSTRRDAVVLPYLGLQHVHASTRAHQPGRDLEPPPDRHRWFFGYEEAERFLRERGRRNGFSVEQVEPEERGVPALTNAKGANVIDSPNATFGTIWCVLKRD